MTLKRKPSIERQILDYLTAHPAAQDTVRGIAEWWLLKQRIFETTEAVEAALSHLAAIVIVSRQVCPDGSISYRLRAEPKAGSMTGLFGERDAKQDANEGVD